MGPDPREDDWVKKYRRIDEPKPSPSTTLKRFGTGLMDPLLGGAQLIARGFDAVDRLTGRAPPEAGSHALTVDKEVQAREAEYQKPEGFDAARMVGAAANPLTWVGPGKGSVLKQALAAAAVTAGTAPVSDTDNYWTEKTKQATLGGAAGGAVGAVGKTITGALPMTPQARALSQKGVDMSLGQATGGPISIGGAIEEGAKRLPLASAVASKSQRRGVDTYGVATVNEALKPVRMSLKMDKVPDVRTALETAHEAVSSVYQDLLNDLKPTDLTKFKTEWLEELTAVPNDPYLAMGRDRSGKVASEVQELIENTKGRPLSGPELKKIDSAIGYYARKYSKSPDPAQQAIGDAYYDAQHTFRTTVLDHVVEVGKGASMANRLRNANLAYANLLPIRRAIGQGDTLHPQRLRTALEAVPNKDLSPMVEAGRGVIPRNAPTETSWGSTGGQIATALGGLAHAPGMGATVVGSTLANSRLGTRFLTGQNKWQQSQVASWFSRALREGGKPAAQATVDRGDEDAWVRKYRRVD